MGEGVVGVAGEGSSIGEGRATNEIADETELYWLLIADIHHYICGLPVVQHPESKRG